MSPIDPLPFIGSEPGWIGAFTRNEAHGGLPNGTRIMKCNSESGDSRPDGVLGTVLGSLSHPDIQGGKVFYFVEWDAVPRMAVGVLASKVQAAS